MSRGTYTRVDFCGYLLILSATLFAVNVVDVLAYSCHEVRTAFQLRQIGPLSRVPETPGTDVDLLVCKHQGPSCCTRKMEESYQFAVKRDTTQNIRSYSFELKYLLTGHASAFQGGPGAANGTTGRGVGGRKNKNETDRRDEACSEACDYNGHGPAVWVSACVSCGRQAAGCLLRPAASNCPAGGVEGGNVE
ncbi:hypothetical protein NHX12_004541 [Muraenolepis orangiensis]|uniref:Uncharacterized protein n=1 Tax=Muraenolepis orangiensis TaxID=630683 RepID=A0A9Q0DVG9_9TELE|nr:hypothetical protein NHX12_004541 [Muraenolepis orangiensis]